jgi:hypothetical protein
LLFLIAIVHFLLHNTKYFYVLFCDCVLSIVFLAGERLLEALALLKKADVAPAEKFKQLNVLSALSATLYHDASFDIEETVPSKVFLKW